ncbi:hypothetical protein [Roseiconus lacunae]|uniref:hypothetical protein n=1 Tax=Roseiconus lacunae TaxID=2605694 RepID=UPI0011F2FF6B|nr:hypothetical protein [Roseiconus lacunae]
MPTTIRRRNECVFNAWLLCGVALLANVMAFPAIAQQRYPVSSQTRRFEGIIDQLSNESNSATRQVRHEDYGRSFSPVQHASGQHASRQRAASQPASLQGASENRSESAYRAHGDGYAVNELRPLGGRVVDSESPRRSQRDSGGLFASDHESAVTLRPQPMTVRRASYEDVSSDSIGSTAVQSRQNLNARNAQSHYESFIDRENAESEPSKSNAKVSDMVTKIAINLCFVLALAVAGLLAYRMIQNGKYSASRVRPSEQSKLKIHQVLEVSRGVNLYLVDGMSSRVLVAVDPTGIKSVNVLPGRFEDALDDADVDLHTFAAEQSVAEALAEPDEPPTIKLSRAERRKQKQTSTVDQTSTKEIDENLIRMLLAKGNKAA